MTPHDEPARDPWLSQALHHAPDAEAAPPDALSEAILREARNAVTPSRTAAPARGMNPLLRWWSWLARPPIAAGFATVMVATLVGVMWWDRPLDTFGPPIDMPTATAPTTPDQDKVAQPPAVATAPPVPDESKAKAVARSEPDKPRSTAPRPPPAAPRERASANRAAAPPAATGELQARRADAAPPPAAAAAPAPTPAPMSAPGAVADRAATSEAAPPGANMTLRRQNENAAPLTPLIDQPERWAWQRGAAGRQAATPALQRWLVQLDRSVQWRAARGTAPAAAAGEVLQLWRDGALHATLVLGDDAVWLTPAGGAPLTAPLSPDSAAALKSALLAATP